jgi:hypothetical protein
MEIERHGYALSMTNELLGDTVRPAKDGKYALNDDGEAEMAKRGSRL